MGKKLLSAEFAAKSFTEKSRRFPPLLTEKQATTLLQVDKATLRSWRCIGDFSSCVCHRGTLVRYWRDWLMEWLFNGGRLISVAQPRKQPQVTITRAAEMYLRHVKSEGRAYKTLTKYSFTLRKFREIANESGLRYLHEVDVKFLDRYRQLRAAGGTSQKSLFNETTTIKQLFNFAVSRSLLDHNPLQAAKYSKPKPKPQPFWSVAELRQILDATTSTRYHDVYFLLSETGMRIAEAKFLTWDDVDFENRVLYIREKQVESKRYAFWRPKTGECRIVPLTKDVFDMLQRRAKTYRWVFPRPKPYGTGKPGTPFNDRNALSQLKKALAKLNLKGHIHTFRHSFISHALMSGVPEALVREWVGHVDPQTTRLYTHVSDAQSHQEIDRIFRETKLRAGDRPRLSLPESEVGVDNK